MGFILGTSEEDLKTTFSIINYSLKSVLLINFDARLTVLFFVLYVLLLRWCIECKWNLVSMIFSKYINCDTV